MDWYVSLDIVDWYIVCINNWWVKRVLVVVGFGYLIVVLDGLYRRWRSIFFVVEIGGLYSVVVVVEVEVNEKEIVRSRR